MRELPSGTVTFLFTDVEGSTKLLHELGEDAYADALARHRRVVRDAFDAHGGVEVDTQGDAFFVAFPTAPGALTSAAAIQEALASGPIRVRAGLHTGTPLLTDEGYVGHDIHRAARIAAVGHGGQILVSASTAALVPADRLRDLGEHRLKDLSAAERIYQLGDGDFPPLKSLYRTNLPVPATPFVGREEEIGTVAELVSAARVVTLVGPGGSGKTRLGLQGAAYAADEFPDGVWWVPLASLNDAALVMETAASAVGVSGDLAEHFGDKRALMFFDNFEHVIDAAPGIADLVQRSPNLAVLTTSREPLHIAGEVEYAVDPLREDEAVSLFEMRARAVRRDFSANAEVRAICERLDNLPLAIELAAARVKVLSPAAVLERLERHVPVLAAASRDAPARQRTLRATIEWSHALLDEEEQTLFRRLGVFAGGSTLEAIERVCDGDLDVIASLVDKSLVRVRDADRYWMLETIRDFAIEQLDESNEGVTSRQRHADHFLALAEEAAPHLRGNPGTWLDALETEIDNLRAALDTFERVRDSQKGLRLAGALARFWYLRGNIQEGRRRLEPLLATDPAPTHARASALTGAALLASNAADATTARNRAEESLELFRNLGDDAGAAYAKHLIGFVLAEMTGEYADALELFRQCVAEFDRVGDQHYALLARDGVAYMLGRLGRDIERRAMHEEILALARATGDRRAEALTLMQLATFAYRDGDNGSAAALQREAIAIRRAHGDIRGVAEILASIGDYLTERGRHEVAAEVAARSNAIFEDIGGRGIPWVAQSNEATLAAASKELGASAFDAAVATGQALSVDDAIEVALRTLEE